MWRRLPPTPEQEKQQPARAKDSQKLKQKQSALPTETAQQKHKQKEPTERSDKEQEHMPGIEATKTNEASHPKGENNEHEPLKPHHQQKEEDHISPGESVHNTTLTAEEDVPIVSEPPNKDPPEAMPENETESVAHSDLEQEQTTESIPPSGQPQKDPPTNEHDGIQADLETSSVTTSSAETEKVQNKKAISSNETKSSTENLDKSRLLVVVDAKKEDPSGTSSMDTVASADDVEPAMDTKPRILPDPQERGIMRLLLVSPPKPKRHLQLQHHESGSNPGMTPSCDQPVHTAALLKPDDVEENENIQNSLASPFRRPSPSALLGTSSEHETEEIERKTLKANDETVLSKPTTSTRVVGIDPPDTEQETEIESPMRKADDSPQNGPSREDCEPCSTKERDVPTVQIPEHPSSPKPLGKALGVDPPEEDEALATDDSPAEPEHEMKSTETPFLVRRLKASKSPCSKEQAPDQTDITLSAGDCLDQNQRCHRDPDQVIAGVVVSGNENSATDQSISQAPSTGNDVSPQHQEGSIELISPPKPARMLEPTGEMHIMKTSIPSEKAETEHYGEMNDSSMERVFGPYFHNMNSQQIEVEQQQDDQDRQQEAENEVQGISPPCFVLSSSDGSFNEISIRLLEPSGILNTTQNNDASFCSSPIDVSMATLVSAAGSRHPINNSLEENPENHNELEDSKLSNRVTDSAVPSESPGDNAEEIVSSESSKVIHKSNEQSSLPGSNRKAVSTVAIQYKPSNLKESMTNRMEALVEGEAQQLGVVETSSRSQQAIDKRKGVRFDLPSPVRVQEETEAIEVGWSSQPNMTSDPNSDTAIISCHGEHRAVILSQPIPLRRNITPDYNHNTSSSFAVTSSTVSESPLSTKVFLPDFPSAFVDHDSDEGDMSAFISVQDIEDQTSFSLATFVSWDYMDDEHTKTGQQKQQVSTKVAV